MTNPIKVTLEKIDASNDNASGPLSTRARLEELNKLLENGMITEEEHKKKRVEVLEGL